jgi:pimeloyl-ACP methyl ester carboxylesterase
MADRPPAVEIRMANGFYAKAGAGFRQTRRFVLKRAATAAIVAGIGASGAEPMPQNEASVRNAIPKDAHRGFKTGETVMSPTKYDGIAFRRMVVNGVGVHYQEAGDPERPTLLLLHGFPSTSRMWDRLIPTLSLEFHVIAPDYPGFGLSDAPSPKEFDYTFDNLAEVMMALLREIGIDDYSLVMQDYGGPIGFRMAMAQPERLKVIAAQNMATYDEALGPTWDARKAFWADPVANRAALEKNLLSLETTRVRHVGSSPHVELYDPNNWYDEYAMLNRPGMIDIHTTLFYDYRTNVASYPKWQAWLRAARPQMQVIWGRYDLSFTPEGALGFARDNTNTETHIIDAGHFPMDEAPDRVRELTVSFLRKHLI